MICLPCCLHTSVLRQVEHFVATGLSLLGLGLIAKVSFDKIDFIKPAALCAICSGILSGSAYCTVRALAMAGEPQHWTLLAFPVVSLFAICVGGQINIAELERFDVETWGLLLLLGVFTQGGQVFLVKGMGMLPCADATNQMFLGSVFWRGLRFSQR